MFLPLNIRKKIVDSILTFIVNGISGGSHPGLFPLNSHSFRWWAPSWGVFRYFAYYYYYHYFR